MSKDNSERLVRHSFDPQNPPRPTPEQEAELRALATMPEESIDTSDIPELSDEQLARMVRARGTYRPTKASTSIRLDSDVLAWLKAGGRGWQTRINDILRQEMLKGRVS
ncbi:BrnA antitoxin family protein [bacterium]|nr:BrnA antitoxin family protein [bacterium]